MGRKQEGIINLEVISERCHLFPGVDIFLILMQTAFTAHCFYCRLSSLPTAFTVDCRLSSLPTAFTVDGRLSSLPTSSSVNVFSLNQF